MTETSLSPTDPVDSARLLSFLEQGKTIACATESIWGLSCDPDNPQAVEKLQQLRQRQHNNLILVTGYTHHLHFILDSLSDTLRARIDDYWPGYCTLLLPDPLSRVPPWIKGDSNKVAVRLTQHQPLVQLSALWNNWLVSASAHPSASPAATTIEQLHGYFGSQIPIVRGHPGTENQVSPIIDLETGVTVR